MIRRLMASTAMLALITAGAFSVAEAQTQPADAEQPAAVQQDATGAEGAAPAGDAAATTEEPAPPPEGEDAATAEQPADAEATADAAAEQPADASATADAATEEPADASATADSATEPPADATATADASAEETLQPDEPTIASAFIGQSVFSSEDPESDNIGDVKDLIIGDEGMITHAVVGVGGFLGIGEKEVAVPFDELQVVEDEDGEIRLIYAATKEQLEAAEEFDRTAFDPEARAAEEQQAAADAGAGTDPAAGGLGAPAGGIAPAGDMAAAPEPIEEPAEGEAEEPTDLTAAEPADAETDAAATDTEAVAEAETDAEADTAATDMETAETDAAATDTEVTAETETDAAAAPEGEATAEVETETAEVDTEMTAETDAAVAPEGETTAEAETDAAATEEQTTAQTETDAAATDAEIAETGAAFDAESGFMSFSADQVRASNLMGQEIFGADDESIGEVSDLVVQEDGETRAALIDVGGFLGVGEKEVAIPFEQIEVQAAQDGEEPRLSIAMSREELEQFPAWEDPADMADQTGAATTEPTAAQEGEATTGQDTQTAEVQTDAAGADQMAAGTEGAMSVGGQDLSAENLIGTAIYSPEEETVGEVGDVIFGEAGSIQAVVVDVGGFLGLGEKPVAIQFDALNVEKDDNGELRLMVNATQEQLENAPSYEAEQATAQ